MRRLGAGLRGAVPRAKTSKWRTPVAASGCRLELASSNNRTPIGTARVEIDFSPNPCKFHLMLDSKQIFAEFETLGEIEVNSRVERNVYDEPMRAYALRWLNDQAMARVRTVRATADDQDRARVKLINRAERSAQVAIASASVAIVAALVAGGAAFITLHGAHSPLVDPAARSAANATIVTPAAPTQDAVTGAVSPRRRAAGQH